MAILSFQSRVVYGHVGNSIAEFALRRLGLDVWPIDTVTFSHHPGHGRPRGVIHSPSEIADLVAGLAGVGELAGCAAVLSGYLGSAENGGAILTTVNQVRAARPGVMFCCDPVMGDCDSGLYVGEPLVRFFRDEAVAAADILTPNHFELETLAGARLSSLQQTLAAVDLLRDRGPAIVLVSSLLLAELQGSWPEGDIGTLVVSGEGAWLVTTPQLPLRARGAGDLLTALFLASLLQGGSPDAALAQAVAGAFAVIEATADAPELRLVAAQAAMAAPDRYFQPKRVS